MNKFVLEELEKRMKNKIFVWNNHAKAWQNILDPSDRMSEDEYQVITNTIAFLQQNYPHP